MKLIRSSERALSLPFHFSAVQLGNRGRDFYPPRHEASWKGGAVRLLSLGLSYFSARNQCR